jgi:hypothetical protein
MLGLATVAAALNANDQGLARIAAVHLRIPDLPDRAARDAMEAADILIKSADWNPVLHPRAGTPPNPGWFAPTESSRGIRTAQNLDPAQQSDAAPTRSMPGDRFLRRTRRQLLPCLPYIQPRFPAVSSTQAGFIKMPTAASPIRAA